MSDESIPPPPPEETPPARDQPGYPPAGYPPPPYGQQGVGYGYGYQQPGYPAYYGAAAPATNGKATAALITGIATLVLSWCCGAGLVGLVAIVLGAKARNEIHASGGYQGGDGMALAGIITGAVAVAIGVAALVAIAIAIASSAGYNA